MGKETETVSLSTAQNEILGLNYKEYKDAVYSKDIDSYKGIVCQKLLSLRCKYRNYLQKKLSKQIDMDGLELFNAANTTPVCINGTNEPRAESVTALVCRSHHSLAGLRLKYSSCLAAACIQKRGGLSTSSASVVVGGDYFIYLFLFS